jgi:hypothetical protein
MKVKWNSFFLGALIGIVFWYIYQTRVKSG